MSETAKRSLDRFFMVITFVAIAYMLSGCSTLMDILPNSPDTYKEAGYYAGTAYATGRPFLTQEERDNALLIYNEAKDFTDLQNLTPLLAENLVKLAFPDANEAQLESLIVLARTFVNSINRDYDGAAEFDMQARALLFFEGVEQALDLHNIDYNRQLSDEQKAEAVALVESMEAE